MTERKHKAKRTELVEVGTAETDAAAPAGTRTSAAESTERHGQTNLVLPGMMTTAASPALGGRDRRVERLRVPGIYYRDLIQI